MTTGTFIPIMKVMTGLFVDRQNRSRSRPGTRPRSRSPPRPSSSSTGSAWRSPTSSTGEPRPSPAKREVSAPREGRARPQSRASRGSCCCFSRRLPPPGTTRDVLPRGVATVVLAASRPTTRWGVEFSIESVRNVTRRSPGRIHTEPRVLGSDPGRDPRRDPHRPFSLQPGREGETDRPRARRSRVFHDGGGTSRSGPHVAKAVR